MLWATTALASDSLCLQGKMDEQTMTHYIMAGAAKEAGAKGVCAYGGAAIG